MNEKNIIKIVIMNHFSSRRRHDGLFTAFFALIKKNIFLTARVFLAAVPQVVTIKEPLYCQSGIQLL